MKYKKKKSRVRIYAGLLAVTACLSLAAAGCQQQISSSATEASSETETAETSSELMVTTAPETIPPLNPSGQLLPELQITVPEAVPMPEYLRVGETHPAVAQLQERLMELGFMDHDEPTEYFGTQTERAVKIFQRQNGLAQDGIVGNSTYEAIMSPDAKYYAAQKGDQGDDIERIQSRLFELGYLATEDLVTGNFGDTTEAAVLKLQELNGLSQDGKVGQQTMNLLYSDDVKANLLAFGDKSDVVLACQQRLKELGYLFTEPDGTYGQDTVNAVKLCHLRNSLDRGGAVNGCGQTVGGINFPAVLINKRACHSQPFQGGCCGNRDIEIHLAAQEGWHHGFHVLPRVGYFQSQRIQNILPIK